MVHADIVKQNQHVHDKEVIFAFVALWMYVDIRRSVCGYYNVNVKGSTRTQPCLSYAYLKCYFAT